MYPLFVIETLGRFPGLTGLFIACILSATLSTFSSGVNSMATVILEDIYKRLSTKPEISNERQVILSKLLCKYHCLCLDIFCFFLDCLAVLVGCLTVFMAFIVSYMKSNIITVSITFLSLFITCFGFIQIIVQIFGAFVAPILGVYLLGLFSSRVKSRVKIEFVFRE